MIDRYKSAYSNTISVRIPFDYFKINLSDLEHKILISLQYFKIIVSDLLFFVFIILIDVLTVKFIIKNERKIITNNVSTSNKKGSKRRLIKCIILNGINFFIFRLPLTLMASYGLYVSFNVEKSNNVVYKPNIQSYMVAHLSASLATDAPFITTFSETKIDSDSIFPTSPSDSDNKFILRMAYDETAILDSEYAKGTLNLLTWPISILWAVPEAVVDSSSINKRELLYHYRFDDSGKEELKKMKEKSKK
jgi:hypothetical protein